MNIVIEVKENADGSWYVCRDAQLVATRLSLGSAIRMARELGRTIHEYTDAGVLVVMVCSIGMTFLAKHTKPAMRQTAAAA